MIEAIVSVPEISCGHCKDSIEGTLRPLAGVQRADVDIDARSVHVSFDAPATLGAVTAAIEAQGYSVAGTA